MVTLTYLHKLNRFKVEVEQSGESLVKAHPAKALLQKPSIAYRCSSTLEVSDATSAED
jgi:hypothetical protein